MTSFPQKLNLWVILAFILEIGLITTFFFDFRLSITPKERLGLLDARIKGQIQPVDTQSTEVRADEIYENIICACCGKSIADCNCGMASDRKAFVDEQAAKGLDERGIYKESVKKYGGEVLFDKVLATEIKKELIAETPRDRPVIFVEPESVDLGEISMAKGEVETTFKVKNIGQSDLVISGMETSCGCTTVVLKIDSRQSPTFGMSNNPTDWSETLEPGQEVELVAVFDPAHHGLKGVGPATRTISIRSSDPVDSVKKVQFEVNVTE